MHYFQVRIFFYQGLRHVNAFHNAWETLRREYLDETINTRLFRNTIARDGPFQFILVHFHCPNLGLACEYRARPVVVCASPNESVAASRGSQANSACRYICDNYNNGL